MRESRFLVFCYFLAHFLSALFQFFQPFKVILPRQFSNGADILQGNYLGQKKFVKADHPGYIAVSLFLIGVIVVSWLYSFVVDLINQLIQNIHSFYLGKEISIRLLFALDRFLLFLGCFDYPFGCQPPLRSEVAGLAANAAFIKNFIALSFCRSCILRLMITADGV